MKNLPRLSILQKVINHFSKNLEDSFKRPWFTGSIYPKPDSFLKGLLIRRFQFQYT